MESPPRPLEMIPHSPQFECKGRNIIQDLSKVVHVASWVRVIVPGETELVSAAHFRRSVLMSETESPND